MFSIWSTVLVICQRKATSEISRLFLAIWMKRVFGANPKPCNRCCVSRKLKLELSCGLNVAKGAFPTVWRVLLKPTDRLVPHWNPCWYEKFPVVVFNGEAGLKVLDGRMLLRSSCNVAVRIGSKLVISAPLPSADTT